jgi:hypothetical protein
MTRHGHRRNAVVVLVAAALVCVTSKTMDSTQHDR